MFPVRIFQRIKRVKVEIVQHSNTNLLFNRPLTPKQIWNQVRMHKLGNWGRSKFKHNAGNAGILKKKKYHKRIGVKSTPYFSVFYLHFGYELVTASVLVCYGFYVQLYAVPNWPYGFLYLLCPSIVFWLAHNSLGGWSLSCWACLLQWGLLIAD